MKLSQSFFYTLRENVKDEDSTSGNLLVRSGMIKKTSAGVYMLMPLGYKVQNKIINIIREEMNRAGALEVSMPALLQEEVYIKSGRLKNFGNSIFKLNDRFKKPFVLGPTHEELFAMAASMKIRSYKDMPFNLYQFQTKFRDEPRPRFGLIRVREFTMKDAYSFDMNEEGLHVSYQKMFDAYVNSFNRMHLDYKIVTADTGVMGGLLSEEFQAVTDIGEDTLVLCDQCDFASNIEVAKCTFKEVPSTIQQLDKELIYTPNAKTIEEVCHFLQRDAKDFVKTLIYKVDNQVVACLVKGDDEVNETKLRKLFQANEVELASSDIVEEITHANVGFAGPIHLECPIIMDQEIQNMRNFVVGANQNDYHYVNVNQKDFQVTKIADIRNIKEKDDCPCCNGKIYFKKGIEIGNTFKLGEKYSKALNLQYLNKENHLEYVWMGSYGIGPGRCMAAIAEQNADEYGIKWPISVAPFEVAICLISLKDELQVQYANDLYETLQKLNIDVVLDDRDERPGVKFKDLELIGVPYRITIGKKFQEHMVEFKSRDGRINEDIPIDTLVDYLKKLLQK
ncbi:MAG: proline--tRNA ligase [Erysipelotrichaceae bacterium]|nr:proline--tRNA ligase [Erysipelotrichaceae bacterium]